MKEVDKTGTTHVVIHFHRERAPIIGALSMEGVDPAVKGEGENEIHLRTIYAISLPKNSRYNINEVSTRLLKHEVIVSRADRIL